MKIKINKNLCMFFLLSFIILVVGNIPQLPWWGFVVPVMLAGAMAAWHQWKVWYLLVGFLAGFLTWLGAFLYFHLSSHAAFYNNSEDLSIFVMLGISGLIGGLLTALALYTGKSFIRQAA